MIPLLTRSRNLKHFGYEESIRAAVGQVLYEVDAAKRIAFITLNRPEKRNALSVPMRARLASLIVAANEERAAKAIVLRGAGPCFCAGDELNEDWGQRKPGERRHSITHTFRYSDTMVHGRTGFGQAIARSAKPVVARVHGYCYGAAFGLIATNADIVVATPDAQIGSPHSRYLGARPPSARQMRILGSKLSTRLGFTGTPISGAEAYRIGFVHALAPFEKLDDLVLEVCHDITSQPMEQILALKARLRAFESVTGTLMETMPGASMTHLLRRDDDEQDFWTMARETGVSGALARDRSRKGVVDPRLSSTAESKE